MSTIPNPFWTNTNLNLTKPELTITYNSYNLKYASIQSIEDGKTFDPNDPNHNNLKMAPLVPSKCNKNNTKCCEVYKSTTCRYINDSCVFDTLDCPTGQTLIGNIQGGLPNDPRQCRDRSRWHCGQQHWFTSCPSYPSEAKCQNTQITFCGVPDFKNSIQNQT